MGRKILVICVDGLGPGYLESAATPNLDKMGAEGSFVVGDCVIPSVTNVNNVSIVTGVTPRKHGLTSNLYFDRSTGEEIRMESPEFLCWPTLLQRAKGDGLSTALFTAKKKLERLLGRDANFSLSAEEPDRDMVEKIGPRCDIYSPDINLWLLRALRLVLRERDPDVVYCSTTDFMMHRFPPEAEEAISHIENIDRIVGDILDDDPDREIYLTADHGMSAKNRGIDIERLLEAHEVRARAIPIIKDQYVVHHQNMGGASYVFLDQESDLPEALAILQDTRGIEEVCTREQAAAQFELMADRIGDIFVLADKDTVFGTFQAVCEPVGIRSHGSRHEGAVPILAYGTRGGPAYHSNYDLVANLGPLRRN